jgi:RHS repeat-associated protein
LKVIADNGQQIANIAEECYRTDSTFAKVPEKKVSGFSYDANGNLLCINTGTKKGDKLLAANSRKLLWDEENRLLASSDNGFVTSYYYDLSCERTVKMSGDNEGVNINGQTSGLRAGITNFTAYINPYLNVRKGGEYTKHIYIGGQRITSKVGNSGLFNAETNPLTLEKANKVNFTDKQNALTATIKDRYDSLGVAYKGALQSGGLTSKLPSDSTSSYFYHSDHLGSSSLITDANGEIVQHVEYVPYGDTFIDERRSQSSWHTPFLFSGKERDEETGLLYVSQRYQDGKYCIWYSVDPLALKYPNISSYVYCHNNPVNLIDPTGKGDHKPDTYTLPKNPNQIDTKTWEPIKPQNIPEGKGHALYWKNKDSNVYLAWDKEDHYHLYTNERFKTRLDANGNLVKAKGVTSAHLEPGTVINLSNAIKTSVSVLNFAFSLSSILTDSPQNPLYIFQAKGSGKQNRAYLDTETNQIYEWSFVPGTKVREVRFYEAYDYINKQWRGVGYKNSQYFEEKGKETYIR